MRIVELFDNTHQLHPYERGDATYVDFSIDDVDYQLCVEFAFRDPETNQVVMRADFYIVVDDHQGTPGFSTVDGFDNVIADEEGLGSNGLKVFSYVVKSIEAVIKTNKIFETNKVIGWYGSSPKKKRLYASLAKRIATKYNVPFRSLHHYGVQWNLVG